MRSQYPKSLKKDTIKKKRKRRVTPDYRDEPTY